MANLLPPQKCQVDHTPTHLLGSNAVPFSRKTTEFVMSAVLQFRRQLVCRFTNVFQFVQQRSQSSSSMVQKILSHVKKSGHEKWDESEMIIRGAMATCEHQHAICSEKDVLALGSALSELHILRRQWHGALDVGIDVHDVLHSTPEMEGSPSGLNVLRLSAVAEAATGKYNSAADGSSHTLATRLVGTRPTDPGTVLKGVGMATPGSLWADLSEIHGSLSHIQQGKPEIAQDNMTQLIAAGVPSTYPSLHYPTTEALEQEAGIAERNASNSLLFQKIWQQRVDIEARSALIQAQIAGRQFKAAERSANMLISIIEERAVARKWELAMAFTLLATTYCRAGRMLPRAESLLREATRLVQFSKHHKDQMAAFDGCHVSLAVRIAWQQAQLLAIMPKRDSEAVQWAGLARTLWKNEHSNRAPRAAQPYAKEVNELEDEEEEMEDEGPVGEVSRDSEGLGTGQKIEQALGDLGAFVGKGNPGTKNVISFWLGRVFYS